MDEENERELATQVTVQTTVQPTQRQQPVRVHGPRIYVASLADYNAGLLHGAWIDAVQPAEDILKEVAAMLARSTESVAEEWAIHDYEGFEGLHLSDYEDLEHVAEAAHLLREHGPVIVGLLSHLGGLKYVGDARQYMEEGYHGAFDSLADYASEFVEACYWDVLKSLPEFLRYRIDYEGVARDMELSGDVFTVVHSRKVHVFDAHI